MSSKPMSGLLPHFQRLLSGDGPRLEDRELLERFLADHDPAAFETLVRRHGPMVLAVCRWLLADPNDAEDAFQATFLVLVRRAGSIGRRELLANWLYGVAYRTALKARTRNACRASRERPLIDTPAASDVAELVWRELRPLLDEELHRLPEKYRAPVVLCFLEGVSKREAARRLGWPEGTLSTRLQRARELLRARLTRRGLTLSAGALAVVLADGTAPAAVPLSLTAAVLETARLVAAGERAAIPASVTFLANDALRGSGGGRAALAGTLAVLALAAAGVIGANRLPHVPAAAVRPDGWVAFQQADEPVSEAVEHRALRLDRNVKQVVWSPDGKLMASKAIRYQRRAGTDSYNEFYTIKVWDAATGDEVVSLGELKARDLVDFGFSPDGATLALSFGASTAESGNSIELLNPRTGKRKRIIQTEDTRAMPWFAFSPDGKVLAVVYGGLAEDNPAEGLVRLYDAANGEVLQTLRHRGRSLARGLRFSPDGRQLAVWFANSADLLSLWNVATGKEVRAFVTNPTSNPAQVAFSRDGKLLADARVDGRILIWDVAGGKPQLTLRAAGAERFGAIAFSRDNRFLAVSGSATREGKPTEETRLWEVNTGKPVASWSETSPSSLFFPPDGKTLVVLAEDGVVRRLDLPGVTAAPEAATPEDFGYNTLIGDLLKAKKTDDQAVEALYLATLGRFPLEGERKLISTHLASKKDRREALLDAAWALVNSKEYRSRLETLNRYDPQKPLRKQETPDDADKK